MIYIYDYIINNLSKFKEEDCGFMFGKYSVIDEFIKIKNISKKKDEFIMSKKEFFIFFFKNVNGFFKKKFNIIMFHVHSRSRFLSKNDKKNMIRGIFYGVLFQNELYLYKMDKKIETVSYRTLKGN